MKININIKKCKKNDKNNIFYKINPSGLSLTILVIVILAVIILAVASILALNKNKLIEESNEAIYESDIADIQAIFTKSIEKVMLGKQGTIIVNVGELNNIKMGGRHTGGLVNYTINTPEDNEDLKGSIVFNRGINNDTTYYTERLLPLYLEGETTWYVDEQGIISLKVGKQKYPNDHKEKKELLMF